MKNKKLKTIILCAVFISLGIILPFFTGQIRTFGKMLLPMHIPVILCSLICGPFYGMLVGFILPVLRSVLFSMPVMFPNAFAMAFELSTYGFICGFLYSKMKKKNIFTLYISLICAMLAGRFIWGIAQVALLGYGAKGFTLNMFISGAFVEALPGIILQLVAIPLLFSVLSKYKD